MLSTMIASTEKNEIEGAEIPVIYKSKIDTKLQGLTAIVMEQI